MDELEVPSAYLERIQQQDIVARARKASAEAIAGAMPQVLARMLELLESEDEKVAFAAAKWLGDKHVPAPLAEKAVVDPNVVDVDAASPDMKELREKIELELEKKMRNL